MVFQGQRHSISTGPYHFLLTGDDPPYPLFDFPDPKTAVAGDGFLGEEEDWDVAEADEEEEEEEEVEESTQAEDDSYPRVASSGDSDEEIEDEEEEWYEDEDD